MPSGWNVDLWDPNVLGGDDVPEDDSVIRFQGYGFMGVRFWTTTNPILGDDDGVAFTIGIDASLLSSDFEHAVLAMGAWNIDRSEHHLGLAPEPTSLLMLLLGATVIIRRRSN